jgi:hypothetical protein
MLKLRLLKNLTILLNYGCTRQKEFMVIDLSHIQTLINSENYPLKLFQNHSQNSILKDIMEQLQNL